MKTGALNVSVYNDKLTILFNGTGPADYAYITSVRAIAIQTNAE